MKQADRRRHRWIWGVGIATGVLHTAFEFVWFLDATPSPRTGALLEVVAAWVIVLTLTPLLVRKMDEISIELAQRERDRDVALGDIRRLELQNAVLRAIAGAGDIVAALGPLAHHLSQLVTCDSVVLALVKADGRTVDTLIAVTDREHDGTLTRDLEFPLKGTLLGEALALHGELRVDDLRARAPDALDANVFVASGFAAAIFMPLEARGHAIGVLALLSRRRGAFTNAHAAALRPIAELLAKTHDSQQLKATLARVRTTEAMADVMLSFSNEINSALQIIVGQCEIGTIEHADHPSARELRLIAQQAERIAALLAQLHDIAEERLRDAQRDEPGAEPLTGAPV
jgi:transcriptional regulator with GAF, ATPase, and Fis domain